MLTELEQRADTEARHAHRELVEKLEAKLSKSEALLAKAMEASVEAIWAEYTDSIESKWTFRKEHIQNAIARTLAELKGE